MEKQIFGLVFSIVSIVLIFFAFVIFVNNYKSTRDVSDPAYHATANEVHEHMKHYDLKYEIINTVPCYRTGSTGQLVKITNDHASHFEVYCSIPQEVCVGTMEDPLCQKIPMKLIGILRSYETNLK